MGRCREESQKSKSEKRKSEKRRSGKRKSEKVIRKKIQVFEKVAKSGNIVFFPMFCGSGRSTSRLAKAAGAEPAAQMKDEKLHAIVARSTCPSHKVQNASGLEHFWKLRCRKSACPCGEKHISKSKCCRHRQAPHSLTTFGS